MEELRIKTALQIAKPGKIVFEAIVNPEKMSHYFIAEGSDRMEEGKTVNWKFPEFPDMNIEVKVLETIKPEMILFEWEGSKDKILKVEIKLEERPGNQTLVRITESKMPPTEEGIIWLKRNTEGWANFLACLKAYLEYDINLRKGAFEFMKS